MAPELLKDVLTRLRTRGAEVTPATFGWAYRQAAAERDLEIGPQYDGYLGALRHALVALADLFVADPWLSDRLHRLARLIGKESANELELLADVYGALEAIRTAKPRILREVCVAIDGLRIALNGVIAELAQLREALGATRIDLAKFEAAALACDSVESARELVRTIAFDMRALEGEVRSRQSAARKRRDDVGLATRALLAELSTTGPRKLMLSPSAAAALPA